MEQQTIIMGQVTYELRRVFQFAMNEVYLRDGSRKVKDVLRNKRESSQYCACPSYGYRKDREDKNRLARTR